MKHNLYLTTLLLAFVAVSVASAQKSMRDPRPLSGRPTGLPVFHSLREYMQMYPANGNMSSKATLAEKAGWITSKVDAMKNSPSGLAMIKHIERAPNGTVAWMTGPSLGKVMTSTKHGSTSQATESALSVLRERKSDLRLNDPDKELRLMNVQSDDLGYNHVRFEQIYSGFPVWASDLYVHFDAKGNAYAINGRYQPTPRNTDLSLTLTDDAAIAIVISDLKARQRWAPLSDAAMQQFGMEKPKATLMIYPTKTGSTMAFVVTLQANLLEHFTYIVNGTGGGILNRISESCSITGKELTGPASAYSFTVPDVKGGATVSSAGFANATATDLNNQSRSIRTYQHSDGKFYMLWDLPNLNTTKSTLPSSPSGGSLVISANNQDLDQNTSLLHVTSTNNSWSDRSSVSAAFNAKTCYDYYKNTHARNAIDGKDQSLLSVIHVTDNGQSMDNAFWNSRSMAYGDGAQAFKPLAGGLDVGGHEMTHGVVEHTAGLVYQDQAGALNESFADVFGIMIEPSNYLMGEDIMQSGQGIALRDMENPDNNQVLSPQPAHMNQYDNTTQDNGGVHINSGIPNKAAVLIIKAIGRSKTEKIYYRALSKYLSRNSQFIDCRNAVEQAAKDLHGDGTEAAAVRNAFGQVGIGAGSGSNGGGDDVRPQTGGSQYIAATLDDGSIVIYDPAQNALAKHPTAKARVTQNGNSIDRAQLSLPRNGLHLYFVNQNGILSYIEITTGNVFVFNNLSLKQAGDIYNASISPDESYAALVSAYSVDPNLYITDGTQTSTIALKPETSQNGIEDNSIQYPDVVAWSPNIQTPLISFDALRSVDIATGKDEFWSMYEIDFASKTIYNLVPSQNEGTSIGNITYSTINPDVIAYNYIDESGVFDIFIDNFDNNTFVECELYNKTIGGQAINDGQRPSFSPSGQQICFSSPSRSALGFVDLNGNAVGSVTFANPLYNPVWFVLGGVTGVENEQAVSGISLTSVTPNPLSGTGSVNIRMPKAMDATVDVSDVTGTIVRTLHNGQLTEGTNVLTFNTTGLPAGIYIVRLRAAGTVRTERIAVYQ